MSNLPCSECVKTKNHCCVADIPYNVVDAMFLKDKANKLGIECILIPNQNPHQPNTLLIVNESMRGKDLHFEPCVFLIDNKCSIYDDRPIICKAFGTDIMPCPVHIEGLKTEKEIGALSVKDIEQLTEKHYDVDQIFEKTMRGEQ